jgi:diguanylate cyclase (GGDEF)-like protein/PAS domain S-box-containing protein
MLGYAVGEMDTSITYLESITHPDDYGAAITAFQSALLGTTATFDHQHRMRSKAGDWVWIHSVGKVQIRDPDGNPLLMSGTHTDVTIQKDLEAALAVMNKDFLTLLESTTDFIYFKDKDSRIRFCSQSMANITGHASWRDMVGKHDAEMFPADIAKIYVEEEYPVFHDGVAVLNKVNLYYREDGSPGWVNTNRWPMFDADGKTVIGIFGISRDMTESKRLEEELRVMATTDFLTGVSARRTFISNTEREIARIQRNPSVRCVLLMFDIDYFKKVNDAYGHAAGDAVLKHLSKLVTEMVRKVDMVARLGGEEFAILMPDTDLIAAKLFSERLRQAVQDAQLLYEGNTISITISIGLTQIGTADVASDQSLARADQALYKAKNSGRNRVEVCEA